MKRPRGDASEKDWYDYAYGRRNVHGVQKEWCYHRFGCKRWFLIIRDTSNNRVLETFRPEDDKVKEWAV